MIQSRTSLRSLATAALLGLICSGPARAVDPNDPDHPPPTPTTTACPTHTIRDAEGASCVAPESAALDDDTRYAALLSARTRS